MSEDEYLDDLLGKGKGDFDMPPRIRYIGEDKAVVNLVFEPTNRRDNYPYLDEIDYDPRSDEDWSDFEA